MQGNPKVIGWKLQWTEKIQGNCEVITSNCEQLPQLISITFLWLGVKVIRHYYHFTFSLMSRHGLTLDFTFVYATLWLLVPVSPPSPWPSSASVQGSPRVIAPHTEPARKRCFRMRHHGSVRRHSTVWFQLGNLSSFWVVFFCVHPIACAIGTTSWGCFIVL